MSITPSVLRRVSIAVVCVCALALLVVYAITDYYANEVSNSLDRDEYEKVLLNQTRQTSHLMSISTHLQRRINCRESFND